MTGTELFEALMANDEHMDHFVYLYNRYQDEKEYEDINDYLASMKVILPTAFKMSKRPFGVTCRCDDGKIKIWLAKQGKNNLVFRGKYVAS